MSGAPPPPDDAVEAFARHLATRYRLDGVSVAGDESPGYKVAQRVVVWDVPDPAGVREESRARDRALAAPVTVVRTAPGADDATVAALERELTESGHPPAFAGFAPGGRPGWRRPQAAVAVVDRSLPGGAPAGPVPPGFSVVAFMISFNEADVIEPSIQALVAQGIEVHLIDNWSTDDTVERARRFLGHGLRVIEHFPPTGPNGIYDWASLLRRVEVLAPRSGADWCVLHDVDERRAGPWPQLDLREALGAVERCGFNAADHTVVDFRPVDNGFTPGTDFAAYFQRFDFTATVADRRQVKAWRNRGQPVQIAASGGHDIDFAGRRVFPYNFLLRHYPIRSQAHGEKKVFSDRRPRWSTEELDKGWHYQYRVMRPGHRFVRRPATLHSFDASFPTRFLLERLAAVGIEQPPPSLERRLRDAVLSGVGRAGLLPAYARLRRLGRRWAARSRARSRRERGRPAGGNQK